MKSAAPKRREGALMAVGSGLETSSAEWTRIARGSQFKRLIKAKRAFILPAFLIFAAYCLLMPLLAAFSPRVMAGRVASVSLAYCFGLSVILLAWLIIVMYVKAAARFDVLANEIVSEAKRHAEKSE